MGKVVMPKNSAVEEEIKAALKIYFDENDWLKNDEFTKRLKDAIGDGQYHSSYTKKVQMTSYYGFTIWENFSNAQSRRRITDSGKRFYLAWESGNRDKMLDEIMYSLEHTVFGRNNCGCSDSDSDVEIPSVFIRAILELGYLTYSEFAFLLWKMEDCATNYTDALNELKEIRTNGNLVLTDEAKRYTDAKPIMMLIRWGFLSEDGKIGNSTKITIPTNVMNKYFKRLSNLKIYNVDKNLVDECFDNDYKVENLMNADNQEFIFAALDLLKDNNCFVPEVLSILSSKEDCAKKFKHYAFNGIMFEVNDQVPEDEQRKDENGHSRYYSDFYIIEDKKYFVSSEWRPDRDDARKAFIDWVFEMIQLYNSTPITYETKYTVPESILQAHPECIDIESRNRIVFGAPGTGKSHTINKEKDYLLSEGGEYERVTFHPDYSYANFVGTYKPVPCKDSDNKDAITYEYVAGPFMRTLVKALQNSKTDNIKPYLLIIEEINRANVSAVFGDVFQLLDRLSNNVSEYPIQTSEDMRKYLAKKLGGKPEKYAEILIPDNMFIWATMNSADQGVLPMDTAFKRRWDFTYLGINDSQKGIEGKTVILGKGEYERNVEWNALRKAINNELLSYKVNEDKLMGPYFISNKNLPEGNIIEPSSFIRVFKNKVLMYLFDDAAKQKRPSLFAGCKEKNLYSAICSEFETKGIFIFNENIHNQFMDEVKEGE